MTKEVSQSAVPLVHTIIPIIDSITSYFDEVIADDTLHLTVHHAALRGLHMLNKYYMRTDDSIVYRIAMSTWSCCLLTVLILTQT